jgi:Cu/Ag efflux protein CusF
VSERGDNRAVVGSILEASSFPEVNLMKLKVFVPAAALLVVALAFAGAPLYADDKPDEGRIVRVVPEAKLITVQDDNGDQWDLMWNETTRMEGKATFAQLKPGDYVHFEYVEREGQKFLTEIKRTSSARD